MAIYFEDVIETVCPIKNMTIGDDKDCMAFNADYATDINNLPTINQIRGGSTCFVIEDSEMYMLGALGWRKI